MSRPRAAGPAQAMLLCAILTGEAVAFAAPSDTPAPPPAEPLPVDKKAEALAHFERGKKLRDEAAWEPALAEFLASRELYPTVAATLNAAGCLKKLKRYDEALGLLEELLRASVTTLPADQKATAQRGVAELRELVGTIEIAGAEPGADITIDGRSRGEFPALAPLRVAAGSHPVRVTKEGFEPFEIRVEVAGGQTARIVARLRALTASGRLRVVEQSGKVLDVVVDGSTIGKTPFDGLLGVGDHVVILRGEGNIGTPPARVHLEQNQITPLTLAAQELSAAIRVEPVPVSASVAIDAVTVGQGIWEGRLPAGDHKVEVSAPGFSPEARRVKLERGERPVIAVTLQRDSSSPFWRKPLRGPRFTLELGTAISLAPTFGGDVAGCIGDCALQVGTGGAIMIHGGYELGSGLGFGLTAGYLAVKQAITGRRASILPVGLEQIAENKGIAEDTLRLRGFLAGGWAGLSLGERFILHLRLGAGALLGLFTDERTGSFTATGRGDYRIGPVAETHRVQFFYVAPEVRAGLALSRHVEVSLGIEVPILINPSPPHWGVGKPGDPPHHIYAGSDGIGTFASDALLGHVLTLFMPGVAARYDF